MRMAGTALKEHQARLEKKRKELLTRNGGEIGDN